MIGTRRAFGRPLGLWFVTGVIACEGLGFVGASIQLAVTAPGEWIAIATSAAMGGLLLFKSYGLWSLHRRALLMILLASAVGGIVHTVEIARGHGELGTWLAAGWAFATLVYLAHPAIRALFAHQDRGQG
jgi:hypothetical protein